LVIGIRLNRSFVAPNFHCADFGTLGLGNPT